MNSNLFNPLPVPTKLSQNVLQRARGRLFSHRLIPPSFLCSQEVTIWRQTLSAPTRPAPQPSAATAGETLLPSNDANVLEVSWHEWLSTGV